MAVSAPCSNDLFLQSCLQLEMRISWWFCGLNHNVNLLLYMHSFGLKKCSFSSYSIADFKNSLTSKLPVFFKITSRCKMLLAQCSDGLFTQPGFNTGKRLETNLRCSCHPSIRRKHLFFLWPQGMVSRCVEFAIFQGWREDTLMKLVSAMGSLFRVFCASEQAQLKSMAGPGCAILNSNKPVQMFLSLLCSSKLLPPSPICSSSWVVLPSPALGCPRGQGKEKTTCREDNPWPKLTYPVKCESSHQQITLTPLILHRLFSLQKAPFFLQAHPNRYIQ